MIDFLVQANTPKTHSQKVELNGVSHCVYYKKELQEQIQKFETQLQQGWFDTVHTN